MALPRGLVATSNAYASGYAAGATSTSTPPPAPASYAMGGIYHSLPAGCISPNVRGTNYFLCGNTWFLPSYGANGVYYRVVSAP